MKLEDESAVHFSGVYCLIYGKKGTKKAFLIESSVYPHRKTLGILQVASSYSSF